MSDNSYKAHIGGYSETQEVRLPHGINDNKNLPWWVIAAFTMFGTAVWSVFAVGASAQYGLNTVPAIVVDSVALGIAVILMGNVCAALYEPMALLTNSLVNYLIGRQHVPRINGNEDSTGSLGWTLLYILIVWVAQIGGEFVGVLTAWAFARTPDNFSMPRYVDGGDTTNFFREVLLQALWTTAAGYLLFKLFAHYGKTVGPNGEPQKDSDVADTYYKRWVVTNWQRGVTIALIRLVVLMLAAPAGVANVNVARYLVVSIINNHFNTPGIFFGAAATGAIIGAVLLWCWEALELKVSSEMIVKASSSENVFTARTNAPMDRAQLGYNNMTSMHRRPGSAEMALLGSTT